MKVLRRATLADLRKDRGLVNPDGGPSGLRLRLVVPRNHEALALYGRDKDMIGAVRAADFPADLSEELEQKKVSAATGWDPTEFERPVPLWKTDKGLVAMLKDDLKMGYIKNSLVPGLEAVVGELQEAGEMDNLRDVKASEEALKEELALLKELWNV